MKSFEGIYSRAFRINMVSIEKRIEIYLKSVFISNISN